MALIDLNLRNALAELLGTGALSRSDIYDRMREAGHHYPGETIDTQIQFDTQFAELDDVVVHVPTLTDGVAFPVYVSPDQAAEGYLRMSPALDVIGWWIVDSPVDLYDESGELIGQVETEGRWIDETEIDIVVGPQGWLRHYGDAWIAVRVHDRALRIESLDGPPPVDAARTEAIQSAFEAHAEVQTYQPIDGDPILVQRATQADLVSWALVADRELFLGAPLPPAEELMDAAGLSFHQWEVVPAGLDPELLPAADYQRMMLTRWGTDLNGMFAAELFLGAMGLFRDDDPKAFGTPEEHHNAKRLFNLLLEQPDTAQIIAYELSNRQSHDLGLRFATEIQAGLDHGGTDEDDPEAQPNDPVSPIDEEMEAKDEGELVDGEAAAAAKVEQLGDGWGARWLMAHCALRLGDANAAAPTLDGLPADIESLPVLIDRATIAADRSQASTAIRLVNQADELLEGEVRISMLGAHFRRRIDQVLDEVDYWARNPAPPMARRNDRCPCGSGRKYKACHLGHELHPLEHRSVWLYDKMSRSVNNHLAEYVEELAIEFAEAMGAPDGWYELTDHPVLVDVALHENGWAEDFLEGCHELLPDDEVLLAQQWMLVNRSVFEVESAQGNLWQLRDLATGDSLTMSNMTYDAEPNPGHILLGRPLPVGDTYRAMGGLMPIPSSAVREALAMIDSQSGYELVEFIGSLHRAPEIRNTDGEVMQLTDIYWRLPTDEELSPSDVAQALSTAGFREGDGEWELLRHSPNQSGAIEASVWVEEGRLVGHVNSAERAEALIERIARHIPAAVLEETEVIDLDDINLDDIDLTHANEDDDRIDLTVADPEVRAAIEAKMLAYEEEWLDLPVPALDGRTPREAAADPVAREDLIRLLASFPEPGDDLPGMSPGRLREALEL